MLYHAIKTLIWLVVWNMLFFSIQLGISSSKLANICQRSWNHQPVIVFVIGIIVTITTFTMNIIAISCYKNPYLVGGLEHVLFFIQLGISSSQLTNICQRSWNHQPVIVFVIGIIVIGIIVTITTFTMNIIAISCYKNPYLVGGLEHVLFFHSVGNFIIPTD